MTCSALHPVLYLSHLMSDRARRRADSGPPAPVVKVLDMHSLDCRAWVACLQDRSRRMHEQETSL